MVTTGLSGLSHLWHRNVDRALFLRLAPAGVAGGVLGAYVVTGLPESVLRPIVTLYLTVMAGLIFYRVLRKSVRPRRILAVPLGAAGGFLDAAGGGGWGPIVASTLIATGDEPRRSVGTVNASELLVTCAISVTFLATLDLTSYGRVVLGLIIGGALAAPLSGYLVRILPPRVAMLLIGLVITALSIVSVVRLFA